ncbi:proton-conducting transporter membrane subunit [Deltaproteobacteria bacterium TL4]
MILFWTGCVLIGLGGVCGLRVPDAWKGRISVTGLISGSLLVAGVAVRILLRNQPLSFSPPFLEGPSPWIVIDGLSAFFMVSIVFLGSVGGVYGLGYLASYQHQKRMLGIHWFSWNMLTLALLGVVSFQQTLAFLISWELMMMFTLLLVFFEHEKEEVFQAGMVYLIAMHVGFLLLVLGFSLCIETAGSWFFSDFHLGGQSFEKRTLIFSLLGLGFGIKAGFIPLHTWLPQAHPVAPSHVSAFMSGVVIKTGIYGIFRTLTFFEVPDRSWGQSILLLSLFSAILGVAYALAQHDLKRLLAYHSVENIGIIGIGIGIGMLGWNKGNSLVMTLGFSGALLHVWNHSLFKGLLFLGAGSVYQATHTRNIEQQGGLAKRMPQTSLFFLIGATAICGLPPFNGFVSEFLIYIALFQNLLSQVELQSSFLSILGIIGLSLVGGLALACFSKAYGTVFLGKPRSAKAVKAKECALSMRSSMAVLAGTCLLIGLLPQYVEPLLQLPLRTLISQESLSLETRFMRGQLVAVSQASSGMALLIMALWGVRYYGVVKQRNAPATDAVSLPTWDCGYGLDSPRLEYTASSFADPLLDLGKAGLNIQTHQHLPEDYFPAHASFESHSVDWFEVRLILVPWQRFRKVLLKLARTQSGRTNIYVLYGLLYMGLIVFLAIAGLL